MNDDEPLRRCMIHRSEIFRGILQSRKGGDQKDGKVTLLQTSCPDINADGQEANSLGGRWQTRNYDVMDCDDICLFLRYSLRKRW